METPAVRGSKASGGRKAQATRASLLLAGREVFVKVGYEEATITDIAGVAGTSVGTIYHHFGGKAELFIALYEDYQSRQQHRAGLAYRAALAAGETDLVELFAAGARAYLQGCWEEREVAGLFLSGGGPPGFGALTRRRFRAWLCGNYRRLGVQTWQPGEMLILALTAMATEGGREVSIQRSKVRAMRLIDELIELMRKLRIDP